MANIMSSAAQGERKIISLRAKEALAAKRAAGARLGRPRILPDEVVARIVADRENGVSLAAIARQLNAERISTAHDGAKWHASTVRAVVLTNRATTEPNSAWSSGSCPGVFSNSINLAKHSAAVLGMSLAKIMEEDPEQLERLAG